MKLLKSAWRLLVGVKDALALLFLLVFFGACFALLSFSPGVGELRGGALLASLDGSLVEQAEDADPFAVLTGQVPVIAQHQTRDVVHALRAAAKDDGIKAVALDLDSFLGGGQVALQDVAAAIDEVKAAKKPVLAFATAYSDDSYLLASHATEIWLDPMGAVFIAGPGGSQPYFKGLLDRFGVNVRVFKAGQFKSAVEPFIETGASDQAREANTALAKAIWDDWQAHVKKARPRANYAAMAADPVAAAKGKTLAETAVSLGLVDKIADRTAFAQRVATLVGSDTSKGSDDFNRSDLAAYVAANPVATMSGNVGIVTVAGEIIDGEAPAGTAGGDTLVRHITRVATDDNIKALVLRIDSPGGSATASEHVRLALEQVRKAGKPVIVSMANVAASGGYWIAMGADRVFAEPGTITGSIGVFAIIPTFEGTAGQYGITSDGVRTTPLSGQPDLLGGMTPETEALIQTGVSDIYTRFLNLVSGARRLPVTRVDEIAQGRVWDGGSARQLGLIDAFGSLDEAVADAAKRAKIDTDDVERVWIEDAPSMLSAFLTAPQASAPRDAVSLMAWRGQVRAATAMHNALGVARGPAAQVRCLECPATTYRHPPQSLFDRIFR
jgi:protease IV